MSQTGRRIFTALKRVWGVRQGPKIYSLLKQVQNTITKSLIYSGTYNVYTQTNTIYKIHLQNVNKTMSMTMLP